MRFSVPKNTFVDAVSTLSAVTTSGAESEVYSAVQIEAHEIDQIVHLRAVSPQMAMSTKISAAVESDGIIMVPARVLASISRVADGAELDVELVGADLHFNGRNGGISCRVLAESQFPQPRAGQPADIATVSGEAFKRAVNNALIAAVRNEPSLWGGLRLKVHDGEVTVTGCDGNRVLRAVAGRAEGEYEVVIPHKAAQVVARVAGRSNELIISGDSNRVGFRCGNFSMRSAVMEGNYANVEAILGFPVTTSATIGNADLYAVLGRVKAVAKAASDTATNVFLTVAERDVTISCIGPLGTVKERIAAEVTGDLIPEVQLRYDYVTDVASILDDSEAVLGFVAERSNALMVKTDDWTYMAMPIIMRKVSP